MGYLLRSIFTSKQNLILNLFLSIVFVFGLQQYSAAQTNTDRERQSESKSQNNPQSATPQQEIDELKQTEQNQPDAAQVDQKEPFDFTSLGRSGQQTAGEHRGSCPSVGIPLTVIAPKSNVSLTTKSHPQFWFYLPYDRSKISRLEFSIIDKSDNDVTRFDLEVPQDSSYISAVLPKSEPGLTVNTPYKWHLKAYCNIGKRTVPKYVSGALVRIATNSSQAKSLGSSHNNIQELIDQDLWIDAVHILFDNNYTGDTSKTTAWKNLLRSKEINLQLPNPQ